MRGTWKNWLAKESRLSIAFCAEEARARYGMKKPLSVRQIFGIAFITQEFGFLDNDGEAH